MSTRLIVHSQREQRRGQARRLELADNAIGLVA
jgi:hypothetical protein